MNLRDQAAADFKTIVEDSAAGFGRSIELTSPEGQVRTFVGLTNDVSEQIDPETGQAVSGRIASVVLNMDTVIAAGMDLPIGIPDAKRKPWVVKHTDTDNVEHFYKVSDTRPDRDFGGTVLILEHYVP